jgi:hypothetical protein
MIEHLRKIHFALIVTAAGLLVSVSGGSPARIKEAHEDIENIINLKNSWEDFWTNYLGEARSVAERIGKREGITLGVQGGVQITGGKDGVIPLNLGLFPNQWRLRRGEDIVVRCCAGDVLQQFLSQVPAKLADFVEFWNKSKLAHQMDFPYDLATSKIVAEGLRKEAQVVVLDTVPKLDCAQTLLLPKLSDW